MKKVVLALAIFLLLAGCNTNEVKQSKSKQEQVPKKIDNKVDTKYPFPNNAKSIGNAKLIVSTPSGDSSNNKLPILIVQSDTSLEQIGIAGENFAGDKQGYFYINKIFNSSEQGGTFQSSLSLEGQMLKPGEYIISAIQFENDKPSGKVVALSQASYEIKSNK